MVGFLKMGTKQWLPVLYQGPYLVEIHYNLPENVKEALDFLFFALFPDVTQNQKTLESLTRMILRTYGLEYVQFPPAVSMIGTNSLLGEKEKKKVKIKIL